MKPPDKPFQPLTKRREFNRTNDAPTYIQKRTQKEPNRTDNASTTRTIPLNGSIRFDPQKVLKHWLKALKLHNVENAKISGI